MHNVLSSLAPTGIVYHPPVLCLGGYRNPSAPPVHPSALLHQLVCFPSCKARPPDVGHAWQRPPSGPYHTSPSKPPHTHPPRRVCRRPADGDGIAMEPTSRVCPRAVAGHSRTGAGLPRRCIPYENANAVHSMSTSWPLDQQQLYLCQSGLGWIGRPTATSPPLSWTPPAAVPSTLAASIRCRLR